MGVLSIGAGWLALAALALDLDGRAVDPLRTDAAVTVLVFVRADCPISNRYAPEVRRLHERFAPRGVRFWLVYPDPAALAESIRAHVAEYRYDLAALRDPEHRLVREAGARITPSVAVYANEGTLVYRGRIDDRWLDFGKSRAEPSVHDLQDALEAVLAGRPVARAETEAVGCYIEDLAAK